MKFLRSQVAAIGEVLQSGTLTAEDQAKAASALAALYDMDGASPDTGARLPVTPMPNRDLRLRRRRRRRRSVIPRLSIPRSRMRAGADGADARSDVVGFGDGRSDGC